MIDDIPVGGHGRTQTFAELLERKLEPRRRSGPRTSNDPHYQISPSRPQPVLQSPQRSRSSSNKRVTFDRHTKASQLEDTDGSVRDNRVNDEIDVNEIAHGANSRPFANTGRFNPSFEPPYADNDGENEEASVVGPSHPTNDDDDDDHAETFDDADVIDEEAERRKRMEKYRNYAAVAQSLHHVDDEDQRSDHSDDDQYGTRHSHQSHRTSDRQNHNRLREPTDEYDAADIAIVDPSTLAPIVAQSLQLASSKPPPFAQSQPQSQHTYSDEIGVGSGHGRGRARVSVTEKHTSKPTGRKSMQTIHRESQSKHTNKPSQSQSQATATANTVSPSSSASALHAQIASLQSEIALYQSERARLHTLQTETARELAMLKKENKDSRARVDKDRAEFEQWRDSEMKKLKRERLDIEKKKREISNLPRREDRVKIDQLEKSQKLLVDEWKEKESQYRSSIERMRKQIKEMNAAMKSMKESMKTEELKRVAEWERQEANGHSHGHGNEYERERKLRINNAVNATRAAMASNSSNVTVAGHGIPTHRSNGVVDEEFKYSRSQPLHISHSVTSSRSLQTEMERVDGGEYKDEADAAVNVSIERQRVDANNHHNQSHTQNHAGQSHRTNVSHALPMKSPHKMTVTTAPVSPPPHAPTSTRPPNKHIAPSSLSFPAFSASLIARTIDHGDGKVEHRLKDQTRIISFPNGTRKFLSPSGDARVEFSNGDWKETHASTSDNAIDTVYYYASRQIVQTSLRDGSQRYQFSNGQQETHFTDGAKDIQFADGTRKFIHSDGIEEIVDLD